jgi:hypothetical protein
LLVAASGSLALNLGKSIDHGSLIANTCQSSLSMEIVVSPSVEDGPSGEDGPKMLFGIEACTAPAFEAMLDAQLDSWARRVGTDRIIISGGHKDTGPERICAEVNQGHARLCKEAAMLYRAAVRAEHEGFEWLIGLHEDSFVRLSMLPALNHLDPDRPLVLSQWGCGQNWTYHRESRNGTRLPPSDWREPVGSCYEVETRGGICSAAAFFVSRGALLKLRGNRTLEEFVALHKAASISGQTDMATSCLLLQMGGIDIRPFPSGESGEELNVWNVNGTGSDGDVTYSDVEKGLTKIGNNGFGWVHVNLPKNHVPEAMRHLDRMFNADQSEIPRSARASLPGPGSRVPQSARAFLGSR